MNRDSNLELLGGKQPLGLRGNLDSKAENYISVTPFSSSIQYYELSLSVPFISAFFKTSFCMEMRVEQQLKRRGRMLNAFRLILNISDDLFIATMSK